MREARKLSCATADTSAPTVEVSPPSCSTARAVRSETRSDTSGTEDSASWLSNIATSSPVRRARRMMAGDCSIQPPRPASSSR